MISKDKIKPGAPLGCRTLLRRVSKGKRDNWDAKWRWRCNRCKSEGESQLKSIARSESCPSCVYADESRQYNRHHPKHEPGFRKGNWEVLGIVGRVSGVMTYRVKCLRCGDVSNRRSNAIYEAQTHCKVCRNKFEVWGALMTYKEIEQVFQIKRSLLLHRRGSRGGYMTMEQAILKGTGNSQPGGNKSLTKLCPSCNMILPKSEFTSTQGRCRRCRAENQRRFANSG